MEVEERNLKANIEIKSYLVDFFSIRYTIIDHNFYSSHSVQLQSCVGLSLLEIKLHIFDLHKIFSEPSINISIYFENMINLH